MKALTNNNTATTTNSPYNATYTTYVRQPMSNATSSRWIPRDDAEWWRSVHGVFDEAKHLQHLWEKARAERLAVERKMAKAAERDGARGRVRSHARPQREPEKRAAVSVRMFAQRVR